MEIVVDNQMPIKGDRLVLLASEMDVLDRLKKERKIFRRLKHISNIFPGFSSSQECVTSLIVTNQRNAEFVFFYRQLKLYTQPVAHSDLPPKKRVTATTRTRS